MRIIGLILILFTISQCRTMEMENACMGQSGAMAMRDCLNAQPSESSVKATVPVPKVELGLLGCQGQDASSVSLYSNCTYENAIKVQFKCATNIAGNDYPLDLRLKKVSWKFEGQSGIVATDQSGIGTITLDNKDNLITMGREITFLYNQWSQPVRLALLSRPVILPSQYCSQ